MNYLEREAAEGSEAAIEWARPTSTSPRPTTLFNKSVSQVDSEKSMTVTSPMPLDQLLDSPEFSGEFFYFITQPIHIHPLLLMTDRLFHGRIFCYIMNDKPFSI